jgi:hypothetical protein
MVLLFAYFAFLNPDGPASPATTPATCTSDSLLTLFFTILFALNLGKLLFIFVKYHELVQAKRFGKVSSIGSIFYILISIGLFGTCIYGTFLLSQYSFCMAHSATFLKWLIIVFWSLIGLLCMTPCFVFAFACCAVDMK